MTMSLERNLGTTKVLQAQWGIVHALILRDIKTRFFGSAWGFLVAIIWPLSHSFLVLAVNSAVGRTVPYGDSGALWFGTGLMPYIAFSYMARFTMMGVVLNRPLLTYPIVKVTDILFARAILELLSACVVLISTLGIYYAIGINIIPIDIAQAFYAIGASMLLGFGFGIVNGIIAGAVPGWITGYALCMIIMWIASGVVFVPDLLPEQARYWLSLNPALHGVEWMRSAYYEGYGATVLDKTYMLEWAFGSLFVGLAIERIMRGKLLQV